MAVISTILRIGTIVPQIQHQLLWQAYFDVLFFGVIRTIFGQKRIRKRGADVALVGQRYQITRGNPHQDLVRRLKVLGILGGISLADAGAPDWIVTGHDQWPVFASHECLHVRLRDVVVIGVGEAAGGRLSEEDGVDDERHHEPNSEQGHEHDEEAPALDLEDAAAVDGLFRATGALIFFGLDELLNGDSFFAHCHQLRVH